MTISETPLYPRVQALATPFSYWSQPKRFERVRIREVLWEEIKFRLIVENTF